MPKPSHRIMHHASSQSVSEGYFCNRSALTSSAVQLVGHEPVAHIKPTLEELMGDTDKNKQRGAAEMLAGLIGGSKHWPTDRQDELWDWFTPKLKNIFKGIKTDTLSVWTSFFEVCVSKVPQARLGLDLSAVQYVLANKDPRRVQPIVDYLIEEFKSTDYNSESSFDATKSLCFFRAFYEELNWKAWAWMDDALDRIWPELSGEHDDVREVTSSCPGATHAVRRFVHTYRSSWCSPTKSKQVSFLALNSRQI
jgi:proteasome activator subunit 4